MCSRRWPTAVSFGNESRVSDVEPWLVVVDAVTAIVANGCDAESLSFYLRNECLSGDEGEGCCCY